MDATVTLDRTEAVQATTDVAAPSRRVRLRLPKKERAKSRRQIALHARYRSANFKRMEAAAKVRAPHTRNASRFLVASGIFHALLVVGLGAVLLAEHVESDKAPVIITDVTFYEAPPQVEIVRQPELLLASEIQEEPQELPAEKKADEEKVAAPSEFADAASEAPGPQLDEEPSATAEIIHSVETDFSRVKYRGSARGVGNASEDRGTQAVVARSPSAPPAPTAAVAGSGGSNAAIGNGGITRSAAPLSLSMGTYPKRALKEGREGMVELKVEVLASGRVGRVELHFSSGHADLDETALNAAKGWKFSPAQSANGPVASTVIVPVRYLLKDAR